MGLQVLNVILNIVTVVLMLVTAASGINPDLVNQMAELGVDAEDVPTVIWETAAFATGIYITATGKHLANNTLWGIRSVVMFCKALTCFTGRWADTAANLPPNW